MTIEETLGLTKWIIGITVPVMVVVISAIIAYLSKDAREKWQLQERVKVLEVETLECKKLIDYLIKTGGEIKQQQSDQIVAIATITQSIVTINANMEKILVKLDKYDASITSFYRDFDLIHKDRNEK